jgi:hypothetical protein
MRCLKSLVGTIHELCLRHFRRCLLTKIALSACIGGLFHLKIMHHFSLSRRDLSRLYIWVINCYWRRGVYPCADICQDTEDAKG